MTFMEGEQSVFNMAMAYLKRIDQILYFCQQAALSQDIDKWRLYLRALYRELSVKIKPEEEKDIIGDSEKRIPLEKLIDACIKPEEATFMNIDRLSNNAQLKSQYKGTILYLLDALEVKMRRKLQDKGMLLPGRNDPRFAVLER